MNRCRVGAEKGYCQFQYALGQIIHADAAFG